MKQIVFLLTIVVPFVQVFAQTQEDIQKAMDNYSKPSSAHKRLAAEVGYWTADVKQWFDTSSKPIITPAQYNVQMILGGLYQEMNYTSTIMGKPFIGKSILGYNNARKEYEMTWIDNMSSGATRMTGFYDEGTNSYHFRGTQPDPVTGQPVEVRQDTEIKSANNYLVTMYMTMPDGKEMKVMEADFKRGKQKQIINKKK
jgi:hypothetical protein